MVQTPGQPLARAQVSHPKSGAARSQTGPLPPPRAKPKISKQSAAKAETAFKGFSLSKFGGQKLPKNYVARGTSPIPAQRSAIAKTINRLKDEEPPSRAMRLALPDSVLKKLLPSLNAESSTIDLNEVLKLLSSNMRGTEFYSNGNATLNRLATQTKVQAIIAAVKQGAKK